MNRNEKPENTGIIYTLESDTVPEEIKSYAKKLH